MVERLSHEQEVPSSTLGAAINLKILKTIIRYKRGKMIITKSIPYSEIKKHLKKSDKIGVISCNACARLAKTGGKEVMEKLANKLKKDGFDVVDADLIGTPCDYDQLNKSQLHGNVQIVLACDAGVHNLKKIFPKHKIISALKTIGIGSFDHKGHITLIRKIK